MIDPLTVSLLLLVVGCALGATAWIDLLRQRRENGMADLKPLATAMKLSRSEQRLVRKLAQTADVPPAAALISRGCFDHLIQSSPASSRDQERAAALRERLFG